MEAFEAKLEELRRRLLESPASSSPEARRAAAEGRPVDEPVDRLLEKVRRHAYLVTDADVQAVRDAGSSEDQVFELVVSAAFGAAEHRLRAGLAAMGATGGGAE